MPSPRIDVLFVDNDADLRELLTMALTTEGYAIETAPDAASALSLIAQAPPRLLLLDLVLQGTGAGPVWQALAASDALRAVPVIAVTALPRQVALALCPVAREVVQKPFTLDALLAAIARHLPRASADARGG